MSRRWLLGLVTCLALLAIPMGVLLFLQDAPRPLPPPPEMAPDAPAPEAQREPSSNRARRDTDHADDHDIATTPEPTAEPDPEEPSAEPASIAGSVSDERGRPVTEFVVAVESYRPAVDIDPVAGPRKSESVQDDRGSFELADLHAGSYVLVVSAAGYTPASSDSIVIEQGEAVRGIRIKLQRGAVLAGRILDADGAPIENAVVRLDGVSTTRVTGLEPARSDADGHYELRDAPRGPFSIRVTADGYDSRVLAGIDARGSERLEQDIALTLSDGDRKTEYVGIGAMLIDGSEGIRVMKLIEGGPAETAGVHAGDLILRIDGKDATGFTIPRAVQLLRGPPGTSVQITVRRDQTELRFTIVREAFSN